MWFYKYALMYYDDCEEKSRRECGITVGENMKDAIDRLCQMYGDFWDLHIDFCGEDSEDCLLPAGLNDFLQWKVKYESDNA